MVCRQLQKLGSICLNTISSSWTKKFLTSTYEFSFCHKAAMKRLSFGETVFFLILCFSKQHFYSPQADSPRIPHTVHTLPWPRLPGQWDLQDQGGRVWEAIVLPGLSTWNSLASGRPSIWGDCFALSTFFERSTFLIIKSQDAEAVELAACCFLRVWRNGLISLPHN